VTRDHSACRRPPRGAHLGGRVPHLALACTRLSFVRSITLLPDRVPDPAAYPWSLPVVRALRTLELHPKVTFLVGENGTGKSTLVEAVAVALGLNAEGGSEHLRFSTRASHSALHEALRVTREGRRPRTRFFLRAESFFNVATSIEGLEDGLGPYGGRSLHEQSHGESFIALVNNRFGPDGLYLLDEPEAALSPQGSLALLRRVHDLVQDGSQFLIATHSPLLLALPRGRDPRHRRGRHHADRVRGHRALPPHARVPRRARALPAPAARGLIAARRPRRR
jgi:predicted ATPase